MESGYLYDEICIVMHQDLSITVQSAIHIMTFERTSSKLGLILREGADESIRCVGSGFVPADRLMEAESV